MPIHGYPGNVVTANPTSPTADSASGVWTLEQQLQAQAAGNWPQIPLQISQSIRFNSADSAYLSRTPGSAGNLRVWTWSGWFKKTAQTHLFLFSAQNPSSSSDFDALEIYQDTIRFYFNGATGAYLRTNAVYRDPSAWYHIVASVDTTQATASNRMKLYVNGVQVTGFSTETYPSQNYDTFVNNTVKHTIGATAAATSSTFLNGYLTEIHHVDGQALTPTSFGEFNSDTGVWQPKRYTGTYGTNGFYLPMNEAYETFTADFLVIAGGGGGSRAMGGGGAGGYRTSAGTSGGGASAESALTLAVGSTYTVTVGAGGAGTSETVAAASGSNSVLSSVTSTGGGGAGANDATAPSGGSGGGGSGNGTVAGTGGAGTTGQGFAGGNGSAAAGNRGGGGGGGAGGVGSNAPGGGVGGNGGAGVASSITGSSVSRGGGGGGSGQAGSGGTATAGGGNGASGSTAGDNGTANTGGGGGGVYDATGGSGGSGVVIIKIPDTRTATFSGGVTSSLSTAVSGYKIYTVTATSTTSETVTFS